MIKQLIFSIALLIAITASNAQNGILVGQVQSGDGRNITDVKIYAIGGSDTVYSDMDGKYNLTLKAGKYKLNFETALYKDVTDSIEVIANDKVFLNITMYAIEKVGDIQIRGVKKAKTGSTDWAVKAKAQDIRFVEIVPAEDLVKTTARNAGDAIKRIPGATIVDGKFANIRGMYDRYNASYLNGAPLPSTESDRKAFSFDIIPASLLDNIMVIKSGTPDLTGDFGGGIIRINTKNIPEKLTQSFNIGFQYNSLTTFREIQEFPQSGSEFFGIPGSNRKLPTLNSNLYQNNPEVNSLETKKFNNDWSLKTFQPMPSPRFNYSIGVPFKLGKQRELGLLMSLNYANTQKYADGTVNSNDLSDNHIRSSYKDKLFTTNVQDGAIINLSLKLNNRHRIDWKNLYTLNYDANSTLRNGIASTDDNIRTDGYSNLINMNRLLSTQINGTHILGKSQTTLTWLANYGSTHRNIPDFRIAQYSTVETGERFLVTNDFFNAGTGRFFSDLKENTISASAEIKHSIKTGKMQNNLKYGFFVQQRNRDFTSRQFVYAPVGKVIQSTATPEQDLAPEKISASGLYLLEKTNVAISSYTGKSNLHAAFVMLEHYYPLFKSNGKPFDLKVIYGVRFEQFGQSLNNDYFTKIKKQLSNTGTTADFLPSINIIAPLNSKTNIRFAYFKTVNRPEMREISPFSFYNFNLNSEVVGNSNLIRAVLHNFDFRYEIFPGKEDMFSIGGFAKHIINPIELSLDPTQTQIRTFTYHNEKSAEIIGAELELRKNLGFMGRSFRKNFLKDFNLYGNFALIKSSVQFKVTNTGIQNRPLQGQSPYVANVSLFYENPKNGLQLNINFNKIGSRIAYVGVPKNIQAYGSDIYEFGRSLFDVQIGKNFHKSGNLKLTIGDIFAQKTIFYQDLNNNKKFDKATDNTLFSFTNGRTVTVSYGYTF